MPYENYSPVLFRFLYDNESVCYTDDLELPIHTPYAYQHVQAIGKKIKENPLIKLYVPAVAKDNGKIETFIYKALYPVLQNLFGRALWKDVNLRKNS